MADVSLPPLREDSTHNQYKLQLLVQKMVTSSTEFSDIETRKSSTWEVERRRVEELFGIYKKPRVQAPALTSTPVSNLR